MTPHYHIVPEYNRLTPDDTYRVIWFDGRGVYAGEMAPFDTRAEARQHGRAVVRGMRRRRQPQRKAR